MTVIASVHLADLGIGSAVRVLLKPPRPSTIEGLRHANVATTAPLGASVLPAPNRRRVGLIAFWEGDDALDRFLAEHQLAATLAGGWHTRLEPLRAFGTWPGLPTDIPDARTTDYSGPAVVLTLGRLRLTQTVRFLRASAKAGASVLDAPGLTWATALTRPPFVATCSIWQTTRDLSSYAYGHRDPAHPDAIAADRAKPFHHQSAFVRFRPYGAEGSLDGTNQLVEHALIS